MFGLPMAIMFKYSTLVLWHQASWKQRLVSWHAVCVLFCFSIQFQFLFCFSKVWFVYLFQITYFFSPFALVLVPYNNKLVTNLVCVTIVINIQLKKSFSFCGIVQFGYGVYKLSLFFACMWSIKMLSELSNFFLFFHIFLYSMEFCQYYQITL